MAQKSLPSVPADWANPWVTDGAGVTPICAWEWSDGELEITVPGGGTGTVVLVEDPPGSGLYVPLPVVESPPASGLYALTDTGQALTESPPGSGLYYVVGTSDSPGTTIRVPLMHVCSLAPRHGSEHVCADGATRSGEAPSPP